MTQCSAGDHYPFHVNGGNVLVPGPVHVMPTTAAQPGTYPTFPYYGYTYTVGAPLPDLPGLQPQPWQVSLPTALPVVRKRRKRRKKARQPGAAQRGRRAISLGGVPKP